MRREWIRTIACCGIQILFMAILYGWLIWGELVPHRPLLKWGAGISILWIGLATRSLFLRVQEWRRLRNEVRVVIPWEKVRP